MRWREIVAPPEAIDAALARGYGNYDRTHLYWLMYSTEEKAREILELERQVLGVAAQRAEIERMKAEAERDRAEVQRITAELEALRHKDGTDGN